MSQAPDQGQFWGRPEALDKLGRSPGRRFRWLGTLLGVSAIAAGAYVGFAGPARGTSAAQAAPSTSAAVAAAGTATCASIGINLSKSRIPAEGIAEASVVRLARADADGTARLLVAQAYVLKSVPVDDGGVQLSVLVRVGPDNADTVEQVSGANADRSLSAAALYDINPLRVLEECRSGR
jgi:hypothetical protein